MAANLLYQSGVHFGSLLQLLYRHILVNLVRHFFWTRSKVDTVGAQTLVEQLPLAIAALADVVVFHAPQHTADDLFELAQSLWRHV